MSSQLASLNDLRGLKVTVMGLGLNGGGLASARFLAERGAIVTVTDMKGEDDLASSLAALEGLPIRYVLGRHDMADFSEADLVVKNPAVRLDSPYLLAAKAVETDISLFLQLSPSPIIAVTGSKGKSSVTTAIHHCLSHSGYDSFLGGNIAVSPLSFLAKTTERTPVVLELSSWQLADLRGKGVLRPRVVVLTSIMPDHMNRYASMDEYVDDKRLIYADQDGSAYTICDHDDSWGRSFASETQGSVLWYSFDRCGLPGAWLDPEDSMRGYYSSTGSFDDREEIIPSRLMVPGLHQRKNILSAALACRAFGSNAPDISHAMESFPGVEHRLELFAEKDGVSWYNDSASTIPQSVVAAVNSFSRRMVLITGGTDKNLDFESARSAYKKAGELILLSGSGTDKLIQILASDSVPYYGPYDKINEAIDTAIRLSQPGDIVILSPGCTSFGMFLHEFDRGTQFKRIVRSKLVNCSLRSHG